MCLGEQRWHGAIVEHRHAEDDRDLEVPFGGGLGVAGSDLVYSRGSNVGLCEGLSIY